MAKQNCSFSIDEKNFLEFRKKVKKEFQTLNGKINELIKKYIDEKPVTK